MERLTMRTPSGASLKMADEYENEAAARKDLMQRYLVAVDRLAAYEDAEEAGRLVVLPCKPGDAVYRLCGPKGRKYVGKRLVTSVSLCGNNSWLILSTTEDWLGKTVFLSREEAEAALGGDKG